MPENSQKSGSENSCSAKEKNGVPAKNKDSRHSQEEMNERCGFIQDENGALRFEDIVIPPSPVASLSYDVPDKRLIITGLKIKNFKSYAGEVVLGPFNKNFTAVVGPNGSGKSNVIDSLLFVFGYRAKKIRSKKVSHLIHKSDTYPNIKSCTVTVFFTIIKETGDSYEALPESMFVLSRTAFADDTSYYEMGNKRVPYKEVARALRRYGIDLEHSRFLILQGEIEAISLMQPKGPNENECGMLEYIEDIIGSNRYIQAINIFNEKVKHLEEEKKEKLNSLKLVEKEKEDLEGPKNKAIEYLRLENKLTLNENSILHCKRHAAEKELGKIVENKKKFFDRVNKLKTDINEIKISKKSQEGEIEKINSELDVQINDFEKFKELYKNLERQDVAMHEEIKHLKTKKSKIETTLSSTKSELTKLKKQFEVYENETAELNKMKEKLDSEKIAEEKKLLEVMNSMKAETYILQEKRDVLESELIKKKKESHHLQSELGLLQKELDLYMRTDKKEQQTLSALISSYEKTDISSKEEELLLQREKEQISTLQMEIEAAVSEIPESQQTEIKLSQQLKNVCLKFEEATNSLSNFKHQSGMLQAFAKEKASGRLPGIYGRLGDLGGIDEKYDVAISTACGQLDHIVTDTLNTAQKCIEFLKKNNLGYTTFIALDKMHKWMPYTKSKIQTPENVPRLFDLIRVKDEKVLPAFYFALKDTLVADNLEQATRIGLQGSKRYRVVTLKGELIDLAGTMSGGGGRVFKGRMGQTVVECTHTPEDVAKIKQEVDCNSKAVTDIRRYIIGLQEQISLKTKELGKLKLSIKKRETNYKAYLDNSEMLRLQIEEQREKIANSSIDNEKVDDLKEKITKKQKCHQVSSKEAYIVEEKVSKVQEGIMNITKGSFGKVQKNVDQLTKRTTEISQSITKSSVNIKACKRNIKKAEDKIKNLEKELESVAEAKMKLETERDASVSQAKEYIMKQNKAEAAVDELKIKKIELRKSLKSFDEKEQKLKLEEIDAKNKLKEEEAVESEKKSSIRSYNTRLAKLKLTEVENDSMEIPPLTVEEIEKISIKRILADSELLRVQLEEIQPELSAIEAYKEKDKLFLEKKKDYDNVEQQRALQQMRGDELHYRRICEFMSGYTEIAKKLKETYQMLTLGGDAELEIVDSTNTFEKGIDFSVRPPRKSWKHMRNLSGGEKTLSSLALVFALHYYRPTPFYVMDEIDAALDVRNVAIVGFYLKQHTRNTQFIIVSLRNIMNELSDHLIGIYKISNCSMNVSISMVCRWKEEDEKEEESN